MADILENTDFDKYAVAPYIDRLNHNVYPTDQSVRWETRQEDKLPAIISADSRHSESSHEDQMLWRSMDEYARDIIIKPYLENLTRQHDKPIGLQDEKGNSICDDEIQQKSWSGSLLPSVFNESADRNISDGLSMIGSRVDIHSVHREGRKIVRHNYPLFIFY